MCEETSLKKGCLRASLADILFEGLICSMQARRSYACWGINLTSWQLREKFNYLFSFKTSAWETPLKRDLFVHLLKQIIGLARNLVILKIYNL